MIDEKMIEAAATAYAKEALAAAYREWKEKSNQK